MADRMLSTIAKLNGDNYHDWKFAISMVLRTRGSWNIVSGAEVKPTDPDSKEYKTWETKAEDGLSVIGLTVEPSQYTFIRDCTNGPEAWKKLKDAYEKNSRATRITLKQQFYNFRHDIDAPIQNYVNGITELAGKLRGIGVTLADEDIVDTLIFNLDNEYSNIGGLLMASKEELSVSDVTNTLLEEERRKGGAPLTGINRDMAMIGKARPANYGNGPPGIRTGPNRITCFRCGRNGHKLSDCNARKTVDGKEITPTMEEEARRKLQPHEAANLAYNYSYYTYSINDFAY